MTGGRSWRSVVVAARLTPEVAARLDAACGGLSRSVVVERAVVALLASGAGLAAAEGQEDAATSLEGQRRARAAMARLEAASRVSVRCLHSRAENGWCRFCRAFFDPDGVSAGLPGFGGR